MNSRNTKVPPFVDEEAERLKTQIGQSAASNIVMGFGWLALTMALVGGAYIIYQYLTIEPKPSLAAPLIILALTYLAGWIISLISIRAMYNLIMPLVIKVYSFGVLAGFVFVYGRAMYKILDYTIDTSKSLPGANYIIVLLTGYFLLVSLYLLLTDFDLIPHAIILLVAAFVHLLTAVYHYVFLKSNLPGLVYYDINILIWVLVIVFLLMQKRLYAPIKRRLNRAFRQTALKSSK